MVQTVQSYLQTALTTFNIIIILYGGYKFLGRPRTNLEQRVSQIEKDIKEIRDCLKRGNNKFADHDKGLEVITKNVLALIEFEMQYCLKSDYPVSKGLERSKEELNEYLSSKKGTEL